MSVELDFLVETVKGLDLSEYSVIASGTTVRDAVNTMCSDAHNCSLIVLDDQIVGIFTDRDVLHKVVDQPKVWDQPVDEVMSPQPLTVNGRQLASDALRIMDEQRMRNLPVVSEEGEIIGNLTHFGIIRYLADLFPKEVYNLPPTPDHYGKQRHGG